MTEGPTTSRTPLVIAGIAVAVCAVALFAAFYFFDGARVISDLIAQFMPTPVATAPAPVASAETTTSQLVLPEGMTDEFALRIWQEQVDSQLMIGRLVRGEVVALELGDVEKRTDQAILEATAVMKDGTRLPGAFGLRKFGDDWYIAYISGDSDEPTSGIADGDLPALDEVDLAALKTVMEEQANSQDIIEEYLDGKIKSVKVDGTDEGPDTTTVKLVMNEDHEEGYADLIAIKLDFEGEDIWFLSRFEKTGSEPKQ